MSIRDDLAKELGITADELTQRLTSADEVLVPTYLTTDAAGNVSADFSGQVHAQGIDLPADPNAHGIGDNTISWIRKSDGTLVGFAYVTDTGDMIVQVFAMSGHPGRVTITSIDDTLRDPITGQGEGMAELVLTTGQGSIPTVVVAVTDPNTNTSYSRTLLDGTGFMG